MDRCRRLSRDLELIKNIRVKDKKRREQYLQSNGELAASGTP
jgi:hypothetical protein